MVLECQQIYIIVFFNVFSKVIWYQKTDINKEGPMADTRSKVAPRDVIETGPLSELSQNVFENSDLMV